MSSAHTTPTGRKRRMKLYVVEYWEDPHDLQPFVYDGLYVVRADSREQCAQFLLHAEEKSLLQSGEDTTDVLRRIRASVANATSAKLNGRYKNAKMIARLQIDELTD